jgi:hypothetical protein
MLPQLDLLLELPGIFKGLSCLVLMIDARKGIRN